MGIGPEMEGPFLVTGAAGFIGFHLCRRLLDNGRAVTGVDNLNDYYDVRLKEDRLAILAKHEGFIFHRLDIADRRAMDDLFARERPAWVIHLAAQAGVRYSLVNPYAYLESNLAGFLNILEGCRRQKVRHLVFASSSSVYGANTRMPFSCRDNVDHPVSLYAATKKANELMAHTYAALYGIPSTGLRFFTVYGPWGRPDMALFLFTKAILEGRPIDIYNYGNMRRDFTYIDDIVEGVLRVTARPPAGDPSWSGDEPDPARSFAPYRLFNIGNSSPVGLMDFIAALERSLGREAKKNFLPLQAGDVPATYADVSDLWEEVGFRPATPVEEGIRRFVAWYLDYYKIGGHNT
ncbi:MAG TPA: NAD-dependent epimerase, partial [Syntrophales bacterium]|nr:NAD-dependent epimerase [Syntrophales bacterium]HPQ06893.1 NAD-dependent epimerase [Syntrophales bacterium]